VIRTLLGDRVLVEPHVEKKSEALWTPDAPVTRATVKQLGTKCSAEVKVGDVVNVTGYAGAVKTKYGWIMSTRDLQCVLSPSTQD
jgi:co-chaperonin GroES (HSP10)